MAAAVLISSWYGDSLSVDDLKTMGNSITAALVSKKFELPHFSPNEVWGMIWRLNTENYFEEFASLAKGDAVLFWPTMMRTDNFGNHLGNYVEALSCAHIQGLHFAVFEIPEDLVVSEMSQLIRKSLPLYVVHGSPKNQSDLSMDVCSYYNFPWSQSRSMQFQDVNNIREIIIDYNNKISHAMMASNPTWATITDFAVIMNQNLNIKIVDHKHHQNKNALQVEKQQLELVQKGLLPFIPTVSILFRCADVLFHGHDSTYGFINFNFYLQAIPADAKQIYVLSESLVYSSVYQDGEVTPSTKACIEIGEHLVSLLSHRFPNAIVALRRGHAEAGFIQLASSEVVISTTSSFGFYALLAQSDAHHSYFPQTGLVCGGVTMFFHHRWHWITIPRQVQLGDYIRQRSTNSERNNFMNVTFFIEQLMHLD